MDDGIVQVVPLNYCLWEKWMAVLVSVWFGDTVASIVVPSVVFDWVLLQVHAFVSRGEIQWSSQLLLA